MAAEGFALDEYLVPKSGLEPTVLGGSFPKASNEKAWYAQALDHGKATPGPDHYYKEFLSKSVGDRVIGGNFSKVTNRANSEQRADRKSGGAAVGQYDTFSPQTTPRICGGQMPKRDRGCYLWDAAVKSTRHHQAPGKYDTAGPANNVRAVSFSPRKKETLTKAAQLAAGVGPGHYNLNFQQVEPQPPAYSSPKDPYRCYLDEMAKRKMAIPAPGHVGIPEPKCVDKYGASKHLNVLLNEKQISPRKVAKIPIALE